MRILGSDHTRSILFLLSAMLFPALAPAQPQTMPTISGESLAGGTVVLPEAAKGKVAVLIFGFTKASKEPTKAWGTRLNSEFAGQPDFALWQLPVLEDVPRLIRGMVISGMKKSLPENLRDHFVPIFESEAELKKLVNYKDANDAYLIVLDRSSQIVQQLHSRLPEAEYAPLRTEIQSLLIQK